MTPQAAAPKTAPLGEERRPFRSKSPRSGGRHGSAEDFSRSFRSSASSASGRGRLDTSKSGVISELSDGVDAMYGDAEGFHGKREIPERPPAEAGSRPLPARRLPRGATSGKGGASGGGGGRPRAEEAREEPEAASDRVSAAAARFAERRRRPPHPAARRARLPGSSLEGGASHHFAGRDRRVRSPGSVHPREAKGSMASLQGKHRLVRVESVNIMDFGVDQEQRPLQESILPDTSSSSGSMSSLVDEDGFLSWDNIHEERPSNTPSSGSGHQTPIPRRPGSCESGSSDLSYLVDSTGFLGWDTRHCSDDDSQDSTPARVDGSTTHPDAEENAPMTEASWHIEDYEDENDILEVRRTSSLPERTLSHRLRRLSLAAADGTAAAVRARGLARGGEAHRAADAPAPREAAVPRTADLKQILLTRRAASGGLEDDLARRRRPSVPTDDRPPARRPGPAALRALFGKTADERASRRINRGDGVDIGELRRELQQTGGSAGAAAGKRRLSLSFF